MCHRICVVPIEWTLEDYASHSCGDGSHHHISYAELAKRRERALVHFLRNGAGRREKAVVQIQELPERQVAWAGKQRRSSAGATVNAIGLSFKVGEYLAKKVHDKETWALVMLKHINRSAAWRLAEIEATEAVAELEAERKLKSAGIVT